MLDSTEYCAETTTVGSADTSLQCQGQFERTRSKNIADGARVASMSRSETATAREWITALKPATWFWGREVPVRPEIARPVLSRLCDDKSVNVQRHARGLYWRGYPEGHQFHTFRPCYDIGALMLGGPGAGLWGWSALNRLEWTLQCPVRDNITVLGRPPEPIAACIEYHSCSNDRRASLNWTEVTVLEALTWFRYTEEPWHECLEHLRNGQSATKLGWKLPVRSSMLRWAAETERDMTVEIEYKIDEIAAALPDESSTAA